MEIPTAYFVIATGTTLFTGIGIGLALMNIFGWGKGAEEKKEREIEEKRKIDQWAKDLEQKGFEVDFDTYSQSKDVVDVKKLEKIIGTVEDSRSRTREESYGAGPMDNEGNVPITYINIKVFDRESRRYSKIGIEFAGTVPARKGQYLDLELYRVFEVTPGEMPNTKLPGYIHQRKYLMSDEVEGNVWNKIEYAALKENPGDRPVWKFYRGNETPKKGGKLEDFMK
jgi:hypothetical protein